MAVPNPSILGSTKKALGLPEDYDVFDPDVVMHINTTFSTLQQLGVGPDTGFSIEDETTQWVSYLGGNNILNSVKTYMMLKVRMLFDPPATSFLLTAFEKQIGELEWRLNFAVETGAAAYVPLPPATIEGVVYVVDDLGTFPEGAPAGAIGFDEDSGNIWRKTSG